MGQGSGQMGELLGRRRRRRRRHLETQVDIQAKKLKLLFEEDADTSTVVSIEESTGPVHSTKR